MIKLKVKVSKDLKRLLTDVEAKGFEVAETRNGHIRVLWQNQCVTIFAGTPSDVRSFRNSLAPLKRHPAYATTN